MKHINLITTLTLALIFYSCQSPSLSPLEECELSQPSTFEKVYPTFDFGLRYAQDILQTKDGGFMILGNKLLHTRESFLMRLDTEGEWMWEKAIENTYSEIAIVEAEDQGYFILATEETDIGLGEVYLYRVDALGNLLWKKSSLDNYGISGGSMIKARDGGLYMTGHIENDIRLVYTDSEGEFIWGKTIGNPEMKELGSMVLQTEEGNLIISATSIDLDNTCGKDGNTAACAIYLAKTDIEGNLIWEESYSAERWVSLSIAEKDGFYLTGRSLDGNTPESRSHIIHTNTNGKLKMAKRYN